MRKVSDSDPDLEDLASHLERCRRDFESIASSDGLEAALGSQAASNVAQYNEVLRVLESGPDLPGVVQDAVKAMRDSDTPRWRVLALATILERLVASGGDS